MLDIAIEQHVTVVSKNLLSWLFDVLILVYMIRNGYESSIIRARDAEMIIMSRLIL